MSTVQLANVDGGTVADGMGDSVYGGAGRDRLLVLGSGVALYDGRRGIDTLAGHLHDAVDLTDVTLTHVERIVGFAGGLTLGTAQLSDVRLIDTGTLTLADEALIDLGAIDLRSANLVISSGTGTHVTVGLKNYDTWQQAEAHHLTVQGGAGADRVDAILYGHDPDQYSYAADLRVLGRGGDDTLHGGLGNTTMDGGSGNDVLYGGTYGLGTVERMIGGAGVDQLYAASNGMADTTFVIRRASDLQAGERYVGASHHWGSSYGARMVGTDIKTDISFVDIELTDLREISGFSGTLTLTKGQLAGLDAVHAGAIRLADGGEVDLAGFTDARNVYLFDTATTVSFMAAEVVHHLGYGNYVEYSTGVSALAVHGGASDDAITALAGGYEVNATVTQVDVTLTGRHGNDSLTGADGDDSLAGGAGRDMLFASAGRDMLTGGTGHDLFVVDKQGGFGNTISDFSSDDHIRIDGSATAPVYLGAGSFSNTGVTEVRFVHGLLKIDLDGNGTADAAIFVTGAMVATDLTQDDFL